VTFTITTHRYIQDKRTIKGFFLTVSTDTKSRRYYDTSIEELSKLLPLLTAAFKQNPKFNPDDVVCPF
jgi:hypothetical protein